MANNLGGTTTDQYAIAVLNQYHETVLSTGRKVVVLRDSAGTLGHFKWSDDGITWTDYGVDIGGWAWGTIGSYVDSGGTERLIAVWRQSGVSGTGGTGGARTNSVGYAMVGTFNVARTTLTWAAAVIIDNSGAGLAQFDFYAMVCHAEGTGGIAHIMAGWAQQSIFELVCVITSGGTMTFTANNNIYQVVNHGGAGNGVQMVVSIDYNPVNKMLFVGFDTGKSGTAQGIGFVRATYSGGVWTWQAGVVVDTTRYNTSPNIIGPEHMRCWWLPNQALVVIAGEFHNSVSGGTDLMIYETSDFTTFTTRVVAATLSAANRVDAGNAIADKGLGDIYFVGVSGTLADIAYYKWTRATTTLGARTVLTTATFVTPLPNGYFYGNKVQWIYNSGAASPFQPKYDELNTNVAPNAPTLVGLIGVADLTTPTFSWTVNDPNFDPQAAWAFRRKIGAGAYSYWNDSTLGWQAGIVWNTGATPSKTFPAAAWANGTTYAWSTATQDPYGLQSGFAADATILGSTAPVLSSLGPSGTNGSAIANVAWTMTDAEGDLQATYQVQVETGAYGAQPGAGTLFYDSTEISSSSATQHPVGGLSNGTTYRAFIRVKTANGQYSLWYNTTFSVLFLTPATPLLVVTTDPANARIVLALQGRDNLLTENQADLETDTTGWAADANCTITRSTTFALSGSASLRLSSTAGGTMSAKATFVTVTAGKSMTFLANVRSGASVRNCRVGVEWQDNSGVIIGGRVWSGTFASSTANFNTQGTLVSSVAPVGAFRAVLLLEVQATGGAAELHYFDCMSVAPGASTTWTRGGLAGLATYSIQQSSDAGVTWSDMKGGTGSLDTAANQVATVYDRRAPFWRSRSYRAKMSAVV